MLPTHRYLCFLIVISLSVLHVQAQVTVTSNAVDVDEDATSVTITFTRTPPLTGLWGGTIALVAGTATEGDDYEALGVGVVSGVDGQGTINVTINIMDDDVFDPDETFTLQMTGISPTTPDINVVITIKDDERPPVNLTQLPDVTVRESIGNYTFMLSRDDISTHDFNVTVSTMDSGMGIPATGGSDYVLLSDMTVSFAANENERMVYITIIDDTEAEDSEVFCVTIFGPQIFENITFYITIEDNDTPDNYHCRRGTSQPCLNMGECNAGDGTCNCTAGFEGENCGIETANKTTGCGCVNGTCMNDGTADVCVCDGGFAGDVCDQKAYFHKCEANGFSVCITPFSVETFNGRVYVLGQQGVMECNLGLAPMPADPDDNIVDWCRGYAAFIPFNSSCGELGPDENDDGVTEFKLQLRVQYTNITIRATDELVTFTCKYTNGSLVVSSGFNVIDPTSSGTNVQRETEDVLPAALNVTDLVGNRIRGPLEIGERVRMCVSVVEVNAFDGVEIDKVDASNTRNTPDNRSLPIFVFGCTPAAAVGIITKGPYYMPADRRHTVCFELEVFVFSHDVSLGNPALRIDIAFTVSTNESDADLHTCSNRKKRQAVTPAREESRVGTTLYLINPDAVRTAGLRDDGGTCSCSSWLVPALIGLGVVAITMAVVIIALTIAMFRHYKEKKVP